MSRSTMAEVETLVVALISSSLRTNLEGSGSCTCVQLTSVPLEEKSGMPPRETWFGRYYEDFEVGDVYRSPLGRTISEADNTWFTLLTMNTNQSHFNAHYAESTPYGKIIVNSALSLAVVLGLSVIDTSQKAFSNLGWDRIKLPNPVFVGDTIYVESQVLSKRESESRPDSGIVSFRTRGLNQDGTTVLFFERSVYIYKRDAPHDKSHFPEPDTPIEKL